MSFRMLSSLNSPPLVTAAGVVLIVGVPFVNVGVLSMGALQAANLLAFGTNVTAVSIPGRMDGDPDARRVRLGGDDPPDERLVRAQTGDNIVRASRGRTLVAPAPWAFAIWGPIYLGEAVFCAATFHDPVLRAALPHLTAPFVAANLTQSLWCAAFRSSYAQGWHKYVSVLLLGGTAVSLSQLDFVGVRSPYMIPLAMHFGWTTAATLVNWNGSLAMSDDVSETMLISVGHASTVLATVLGVGVTLTLALPAYGFTIAWALAACANGMKVQPDNDKVSLHLKRGAKVQKVLLTVGSLISAGASIYSLVM